MKFPIMYVRPAPPPKTVRINVFGYAAHANALMHVIILIRSFVASSGQHKINTRIELGLGLWS